MDKFQEVSLFLAVAEARSFAAAGRRLGLSASTVTRAVAALEARLGILLLVRTTRHVRLTDAGEQFAHDCRAVLDSLAQAEEAAAGGRVQPRGELSVTAPALFGELHVMPAIVDYLRQHRQVRLRALLVDRVVRLLDEGVDVAVRIGRLPDSSLTAIHVGDVRRIVCAAPDFLARAGVPSHPDMLPRYCTVSVVMEGQMDRWRFVCDGQPRDLDVQAQLTVTSSQAVVRAAVQGWGLAQVVSYQAAGALREGALRVVLREFEPPPLPVHVVYPEGRKGAAKVRSFVEFCVERLRAELGELPT